MTDSLNLLTVPELAHELRVPASWVYQETRKTGPGAIPRVRVGKYLRFELHKVREWLDSRQREPGLVR